MARLDEVKRLELVHEDIISPVAQEVSVEDIRGRIADLDAAHVTDEQPLPSMRFVQAKGSGKIDLSGGLKRFFKANPDKLDQLYESIVTRAIEGDHNATKLVFDRVEGAVPQRVGIAQLTTEQIASMLELDAERDD